MLACCALVAVLVVAGEPRHEVLRFGARFVLSFFLEVLCVIASKCCGQATMVKDLDFSILPHLVGETEIM